MDFTGIKDIRGGMKNINCMFIVLEITSSTKTKENREVFSFKVADQTASIQCSIWDEPGKILQPGDIVRLIKCYASLWRGSLTLYSGKNGEIQRVGDFCMIFNEQINMSEPKQDPVVVPAIPATNGNGRAQPTPPITLPAIHSALPPPAETKPPPKVSNNSSSRNYIRKPPNKK